MRSLLKVLVVVVGLILLAGLALLTLRTGPPPLVELGSERNAVGRGTVVVARARVAGRGLGDVRLEVEQAGRVWVVARREHRPLAPWRFAGPRTLEDELRAEVGYDSIPELAAGDVTIRAVAERAGTWLLSPGPVIQELRLPVRRTPPTLSVLSRQHYVAQGGAGLVVYRAGETAASDYVSAGSWRFPGVRLPSGASGERIALFGVPWDAEDASALRVVVEDDAGHSVSAAFVDRFERRPPARDRIRLDDAFMTKVTGEIRERTPGLASRGSLLEDYLAINRELRAANTRELVELGRDSAPVFTFTEAFLPLRNAKVMSAFADRRSYLYEGREVDQQTHLGFDLASVARAEVQATNRGVVRLARYFGIYGNAVVIDHGLGLMSLCAHLSSIDVAQGQRVERGDVIGRTGATGLAGGDHLHFTTLVHGLPVNPIEWWDAKWIRDRITSKIPPGPG